MEGNHFTILDVTINQILNLHHQFSTSVSLLSSSQHQDPYSKYKSIHAFGAKEVISSKAGSAFEQLQFFIDQGQWLFGVLGYDLKNEIEGLESNNDDKLDFPDICFFRPEFLIIEDEEGFHFSGDKSHLSSLIETQIEVNKESSTIGLSSKMKKVEYLSKFEDIQRHIKKGDLYEMNFCQEFYQENFLLDMISTFNQIRKKITTPFMGFFQHDAFQMVSVSPERYLAKRGNQIISQPIKGTAKRGGSKEEDVLIKAKLTESLKEKTENTMIVDLVRNDLGRCALPGSVKVEEYLKLYTFPNIHQLVSRISAVQKEDLSVTDLIKNTFPMGSMTGAPKHKVMQITEDLEETKRGWYSGGLGYIDPNGDFDFNVIIRSLLYNQSKKYLSYTVGGGITSFSDGEQEYEECLVKLNSILDLLE